MELARAIGQLRARSRMPRRPMGGSCARPSRDLIRAWLAMAIRGLIAARLLTRSRCHARRTTFPQAPSTPPCQCRTRILPRRSRHASRDPEQTLFSQSSVPDTEHPVNHDQRATHGERATDPCRASDRHDPIVCEPGGGRKSGSRCGAAADAGLTFTARASREGRRGEPRHPPGGAKLRPASRRGRLGLWRARPGWKPVRHVPRRAPGSHRQFGRTRC